MYPVLISIGRFHVDSFGFLYNVVVAVCAIALTLELERLKSPAPRLPWLLRWLPASLQESLWFAGAWIATSYMAVGLLGARTLYMAQNTIVTAWGKGLGPAEWLQLFRSSNNDSMWFGGFLLCVLWTAYIARLCRMSYLKFLDIAVLLSVLGQVPGRLACLLGGCCFGKPTNLPWGIALDSPFSLLVYPRGTRLHPSQIYEMAVAAILFAYMWHKHSRNSFDGQTTIRYLILGGLARFVTEFFRADTPRGLPLEWLSLSQLISVGMVIVGAILHYRLSSRTRNAVIPKPETA